MGKYKPSKKEVRESLEFYEEVSREADGTWQRAFGHLKPGKAGQTEAWLQKAVCKYLRLQYPGVRFTSNMEGERLSGPNQAAIVASLRSHRGIPDIMIFKRTPQYVGLAIELKRPGYDPYKKDGSLKKDEHLLEQQEYINYLVAEGWAAGFMNDFDKAKKLIDKYMKHAETKGKNK